MKKEKTTKEGTKEPAQGAPKEAPGSEIVAQAVGNLIIGMEYDTKTRKIKHFQVVSNGTPEGDEETTLFVQSVVGMHKLMDEMLMKQPQPQVPEKPPENMYT